MPRPDTFAAALAVVFATACSTTVQHSSIRPDYEAADKQQTVRLATVATPVSSGDDTLGMLAAKIAQRYANHHRDFVVKDARVESTPLAEQCRDDMQGILQIEMTIERDGDEVTAGASCRIVRCRDEEEVWSARGSGSWPASDPQISQVIAQYRSELGEAVVPFVPAAFHLLRALLDTLPYPELASEELVMEKIELED